jgi:hypothetical protein
MGHREGAVVMTKSMSATIASVSAACLFAPVAIAQSPTQQNAWVSGLGKDVSTCGPETTPCRTFQFAHDHIVLAGGGQIRVKDPADYSALTISKSISIINDGVGVAGISVPSGDAISINAVDDDSIFIKGLSLDGGGKGSSGISVNSAGSVTVTGSTFTGFGAFQRRGNINYAIRCQLYQHFRFGFYGKQLWNINYINTICGI